MEDKEIVEIFNKILKEMDENIVNDESDRTKLVSNMNTLLVYCDINEKFRKNYCDTEDSIRKMLHATTVEFEKMSWRFEEAIKNKREVQEMKNKYRIKLVPFIQIFVLVLFLFIILSILPVKHWEVDGSLYRLRACICVMEMMLPLFLWRWVREMRNNKDIEDVKFFIKHLYEYNWDMRYSRKIPVYFSMRTPMEKFSSYSDYMYIELIVKAIKTCSRYHILQNIKFEKSEKFDYDDTIYIIINLTEDTCRFITKDYSLQPRTKDLLYDAIKELAIRPGTPSTY